MPNSRESESRKRYGAEDANLMIKIGLIVGGRLVVARRTDPTENDNVNNAPDAAHAAFTRRKYRR